SSSTSSRLKSQRKSAHSSDIQLPVRMEVLFLLESAVKRRDAFLIAWWRTVEHIRLSDTRKFQTLENGASGLPRPAYENVSNSTPVSASNISPGKGARTRRLVLE